jgi:hypothetical protein
VARTDHEKIRPNNSAQHIFGGRKVHFDIVRHLSDRF